IVDGLSWARSGNLLWNVRFGPKADIGATQEQTSVRTLGCSRQKADMAPRCNGLKCKKFTQLANGASRPFRGRLLSAGHPRKNSVNEAVTCASLRSFVLVSDRCAGRQKYPKDRSIGLTKGHRQAPVMIFNDRSADRQPNAHTVGFCRKERLEDAVDVPRIDTNSGVFHRDQQIVLFIYLILTAQTPRTFFTILLSSHAVLVQI